jgi:hypothetical protein
MRESGAAPTRDLHAAMVCLWWTSMNLLSVAICCADASIVVGLIAAWNSGRQRAVNEKLNRIGA